MSDFSPAIAKGVKTVFPRVRHGKCSYHILQNIRNKFPCEYLYLEEYLYLLGLCSNERQLDQLWRLVSASIKKNEDTKVIADEFLNYFNQNYLNTEGKCFYAGFLPPGFDTTNNMVEGANRYLKKEIYEYKVMALGIVQLNQ